jgi:hypothetical protein
MSDKDARTHLFLKHINVTVYGRAVEAKCIRRCTYRA